MNLNLTDFVSQFKVHGNKLEKQSNNVVPKFSPTFSPNPKSENFGLHCRYQLLRYKLWQLKIENAWNDLESCDGTCISMWKEFLNTSYAQNHVPSWHLKLEAPDEIIDDEEYSSDDMSTIQSRIDVNRDDWIILSNTIPCTNEPATGNTTTSSFIEHRASYSEQQINGWQQTKENANSGHFVCSPLFT